MDDPKLKVTVKKKALRVTVKPAVQSTPPVLKIAVRKKVLVVTVKPVLLSNAPITIKIPKSGSSKAIL